MAKGYIYVVTTVQRDYFQRSPRHIPVWVAAHRRLYLGPCKVPIRRMLAVGDTVFGISPSATRPRRIVFVAKIAQKVTYRTSYARWPALRGPDGPIHVKPVDRPGRPFPECAYAFIPGSMHANRWKRDLANPTLDGFFVCAQAKGRIGRWLGPEGPVVEGAVLEFLRGCRVHGNAGLLSPTNAAATAQAPIGYHKPGRDKALYIGLHLETDDPEALIALCQASAAPAGSSVKRAVRSQRALTRAPSPRHRRTRSTPGRHSGGCR